MATLGAVLTWLLLLSLLALPPAILGLWALLLWQRVQRSRRPETQPYDRAYERALHDLAYSRGALDARRDVAELQL